MATQYEALPGGDGGAWATAEPPARLLVPVAATTAGEPIRRRQIKSRRVDLDGEFAGWWVQVRTNTPIMEYARLLEFEGAEGAALVRAMGEVIAHLFPQLIVSWNWVDEFGADLPCDAAGFATLSVEEFNAIFGGIFTATSEETAVPKP